MIPRMVSVISNLRMMTRPRFSDLAVWRSRTVCFCLAIWFFSRFLIQLLNNGDVTLPSVIYCALFILCVVRGLQLCEARITVDGVDAARESTSPTPKRQDAVDGSDR